MFDLGWSELLVIGVATILIFGPKELPVVYRTVTQWLGKARSVAREFQNTLDDVAREAELDKLRNTVRDATSGVGSMLDQSGTFDGVFDDPDPKISPAGPASKPSAPPETPAVAAPNDGAESARPAATQPAAGKPSTDSPASGKPETGKPAAATTGAPETPAGETSPPRSAAGGAA
ncbi:MAG: Sec-independent protein translocase protein TatB [Pseudomonadota bacterium]|nr:Sec-independent protein translocase protein TatB [Pseudomonadota bacterium]